MKKRLSYEASGDEELVDDKIKDCRYCEYAACFSKDSLSVDCYVDDFQYFDHHVENPKEAEKCEWFSFCDIFPKC